MNNGLSLLGLCFALTNFVDFIKALERTVKFASLVMSSGPDNSHGKTVIPGSAISSMPR